MDWSAHFHVAEDDKIDRLMETLFGQPRMWFHSNTHPGYFDGDHPAILKKMFLTRWSLKGRTADALYAKWQDLSFDHSKDDIKEFIGDLIQTATQLGYVERAQVMAIRGVLPPDIHNTTLNIEVLNDLKEYIIQDFENPRVKKAYGQSTSQEATVGALSMGKFVEDYTTQVNSNDISELISKMDS